MAKRHPKERAEDVFPPDLLERPFPSENDAAARAANELERRRRSPTSGLPTDSDDLVRERSSFKASS